MAITRIRVPSTWATPGIMGKTEYIGLADFQLGVGPCGKTVERLECMTTQYGVIITQHCTCTEMKEFIYPWHTVTGRVEVTHG